MLFKFAQLKREDEILGSERVRVSLGADGEEGGGRAEVQGRDGSELSSTENVPFER